MANLMNWWILPIGGVASVKGLHAACIDLLNPSFGGIFYNLIVGYQLFTKQYRDGVCSFPRIN